MTLTFLQHVTDPAPLLTVCAPRELQSELTSSLPRFRIEKDQSCLCTRKSPPEKFRQKSDPSSSPSSFRWLGLRSLSIFTMMLNDRALPLQRPPLVFPMQSAFVPGRVAQHPLSSLPPVFKNESTMLRIEQASYCLKFSNASKAYP